MYRRRKQRPPRQVEQTAAMQERDELQESVNQLTGRNQELRAELQLKELEVEKLLHEKIQLGRELLEYRTIISFLQGEESAHSLGPGSHFGFKRFLPEWRS